jgi:hypothetical protein
MFSSQFDFLRHFFNTGDASPAGATISPTKPELYSSTSASTSAPPNTEPTSVSSNIAPLSDNAGITTSKPAAAKISTTPSSPPSNPTPTIDDLLTYYSKPTPNYNQQYAKEALEISDRLPKRSGDNFVIPWAQLSQNEITRLQQITLNIPYNLLPQRLTVLSGDPFVVSADNADSPLDSLQERCQKVFSAVNSEISQWANRYPTTDPHKLLDLHKGIPLHPLVVIFPGTKDSGAIGEDKRPLLKSEVSLFLKKTPEEYIIGASMDKDGKVASIFYVNGTNETDIPIVEKTQNTAHPRAHAPTEIDIATGLKLRAQGMDTLVDQVKNHGALHCIVRLKPSTQPKPVPAKNKSKKEKIKVKRQNLEEDPVNPWMVPGKKGGSGYVAPSVDAVVDTGERTTVTYVIDQGKPLEITDVRFYYAAFSPINPNRGMFLLEDSVSPDKMNQSARGFTSDERKSFTLEFAKKKLEVIEDYIRSSYPHREIISANPHREIIKKTREFLIKKSIDEQYTETILSLAILTYIGSKISDFTMASFDRDLINLSIKFTLSTGIKIAFVNKLVSDFNKTFNTSDCQFSQDKKNCLTISFPGKLISPEILEKILNSFLTTQISQGTQNYMQPGKLNIINSALEKVNDVLEFNDIAPICIGTVLLKLANCSENTTDIYSPRPGIFETYFYWKISKNSATQVIEYLNTFAGKNVATFIREVDTANTQFCEIAIQNFFFQLPEVVEAIENVCDRNFFLDPELCRYQPQITYPQLIGGMNELLKLHDINTLWANVLEHSILHVAGINFNLITSCDHHEKGDSLLITIEHTGDINYAKTITEKLISFYGKCYTFIGPGGRDNEIAVAIPLDQLALKWGEIKASAKHLLSYPENVSKYGAYKTEGNSIRNRVNPPIGLDIPASNHLKITEKIKAQTKERGLENSKNIFPHAALHAAGIDISLFKECEFRDGHNEDVIITGRFTNHLDPEINRSIFQSLRTFYNCQLDFAPQTKTLTITIPYTTCFAIWDEITRSVEYLLSYPENIEHYNTGEPPTRGLTRFFSRESILSDVVSLSARREEMEKKIKMVIDENISVAKSGIVEHAIMHAAGIDISSMILGENTHKDTSFYLITIYQGHSKSTFDKLKLFYGDECSGTPPNGNEPLTIGIPYSALALKFPHIMSSIRHLVSYPENVTSYRNRTIPTAGLTIFPSGVLHVSQLTDTEIDEIDSSADLSLSPQVAAISSTGWKPGFSYGGETPKEGEIINPDYQTSSARVQI